MLRIYAGLLCSATFLSSRRTVGLSRVIQQHALLPQGPCDLPLSRGSPRTYPRSPVGGASMLAAVSRSGRDHKAPPPDCSLTVSPRCGSLL
ncbi:unnamed protein product [Boreogadus saida]